MIQFLLGKSSNISKMGIICERIVFCIQCVTAACLLAQRRRLAQLPQLGVEIVAKSLILNARLALHFAQATREFQAVGKREA